MSKPIVVKGVHTGITGKDAWDYPARLEWGVFSKNVYYVTLFAKALEIMAAETQNISNPLGYFQISGICQDN
jgi:hypothetical protein